MTSSKRLVFFGNERLVSGLKQTQAPILRGLIERGYDIAAIVVNHTPTQSRNARPLEVASIATEHNIPLLTPHRPIDCLETLTELNADAAVLAAYGNIIPKRIIDLFDPIGIINIHPSLLPQYRGPTPIETTIVNGDTTTGVSIMRLAPGMDDGPLFGQATVEIPPNSTKFELYDTLSTAGADLLFSLLPHILDTSLQPTPQQDSDVSYTSLITKTDGIIDPLTEDAQTIERKVRAYLGFPKSKLSFKDIDVIVTSASVIDQPLPRTLVLECANHTWLQINQLIAPSGRSMSGADFLLGYNKLV